MGMAVAIGPITNGVMALLAICLIPLVRRLARGASIAPYVVAGVLGPIAAILVDGALILSMDLHGC